MGDRSLFRNPAALIVGAFIGEMVEPAVPFHPDSRDLVLMAGLFIAHALNGDRSRL
jgi:hypothetical protein